MVAAVLSMWVAQAVDADCTTEGRATEACIPLQYYAHIMPQAAMEAPYFSREPEAARADAENTGVVVESVEASEKGLPVFRRYEYTLWEDGKRLTVHRLSLYALQDEKDTEVTWNNIVFSNYFSYKTTEPGVFVIDGAVYRFEQRADGRIRAIYKGRLGADGQVVDEQPLYRAVGDLGRVVFIGDSITHGVGAASYRWALHKILVDNEVRYEEMGVEQGNRLPEACVAPGTLYRGVPFRNLHCAMTSERAYEIAGRKHISQRLDGTDILDWLGLDETYSGSRRLPAAPDTAFILIGTNDMLGDYDGHFDEPANLAAAKTALLDEETGDMSAIVAALRRANPQVRIVALAVPTWEYSERNNKASSYAALAEYNRALAAWAEKKSVIFVDVNRVLADEGDAEMPGRGARGFFYKEPGMHLHPSWQGDLLIAGAVAEALGIPGRTAGVKAPSRPERWKHITLNPGENRLQETPMQAVALSVQHDGKPHPRLQLTLGDGEHSGRLTVTQHAISWGEGVLLYAADTNGVNKHLRVVWLPGDAEQGIAAGYYVWLNGRLIGEALPNIGSGFCGATVLNDSDRQAEIYEGQMDASNKRPE